MLKSCIIAENRKLHASPVWIMFFILPTISAAYGTYNYLQNLDLLTKEWYSLWTQHTLFYSLFFFPSMVGVYAGYLWRLEHRGHNWNMILTAPVRPICIFLAKFVVVLKMMLLTHLFCFALYVFCGKVFARLGGLPPLALFSFLLRGLIGGLAVAAAQLLLSMIIRSFAVPVFAALFGGVLGIPAMNKNAGLLWPYALMQMGMNSNRSTDMLEGNYPAFFIACALHLAVLLLVANLALKRRR